jgi:hypothetical protein
MTSEISRRRLLQGATPFAAAVAAGPSLAFEGSRKPLTEDAEHVYWRRPAHRDLPLPDWGPYSDHLNGISHITDPVRGLRVDFALAPAILRRETLVPYAEMGLAMQPVRADPELGYIAWDYELVSGVSVRLEWLALNASGGMLRATMHNRTATAWPVVLNWIARLAPPSNPPRTRDEEASGIAHHAVKGIPARPAEVGLPPSAIWVNALHYECFEWGQGRFDDHLVTDGRRRGEIFEDGFAGYSGIGQGFGKTTGDQVQWRFDMARPLKAGVLRFRYRMSAGSCAFRGGGLIKGEVLFTSDDGSEAFRTLDIPVGAVAGEQVVSLTALGDHPIELNGFVLAESDDMAAVSFRPHAWALAAHRQDDAAAGQTVMTFPQETGWAYAMAWSGGTAFIHSARTDDLRTLDGALNDPSLFGMSRVPQGDRPGEVTIAAPSVITLGAGETVVRDGFVAVGDAQGVTEMLQQLRGLDCDRRLEAARAAFVTVPGVTAQSHQEGAQRLLATIATNMLFPIWTGGQWVRNYCPGREWSSVYTWDSGFTGLGLACSTPRLSTALLDTYLSPVDDEQAAFLHHGTPLPTQFYLFQELWNRNGDLNFARARYPSLARYLRFLLGRETGSTCRDLKSGLIRTYDYFYNTGGMDDYPAQMAVHSQKKASRVAPVISSAHAIRCAKILCQVASAVGATKDLKEWRADIESLGNALQAYSWDEASGYFAYVEHGDDKQPIGHLRSAAGENFNMGLDGVSPLVADICTPAQIQQLIDNLMTPGRLWTPSGITAVDRRASYYNKDGYWNGTVWMPHQWFMWKAMLDYGEGDKAWQIAKTALDVYSAEVARSGRTYENFDADTGIGGAWHPFGALSSPVRNWFEAYCLPGVLSVGLNTRVVRQVWQGGRAVKAGLDISGSRPVTVLAVLAQTPIKAMWRGRPVEMTSRADACVEMRLDPGRGDLEIA